MIEAAAWVGSICLAACAAPQAWLSWRQGHSSGLSVPMLWLWGIGDALMLVDVSIKGYAPLVVNYAANLLIIGVIARYRIWPREKAAT